MNYQSLNDGSRIEEGTVGSKDASACGPVWSIILAGGNGDRIGDLVQNWIGRPVPKQYCAFTGKRSMLQHTLSRADALSLRERQFVLIAKDHLHEAQAQLANRWSHGVIVQPSNRDTLPGILLPLTHVYARDPKATVAIFPSDHFIYPENNFRIVMEKAVQAAEALPNKLMLIGAPAHSLELEYGWVCPGESIWASGAHSVHSVNLFLEKPARAHAAVAMSRGGLWNTMIVVSKAQTIWRLASDYFPEIMRLYKQLYEVVGTSHEEEVAKTIYEIMPARNFSSDLLAQALNHIGVIPMKDVLWCDWGRKERILEMLHYIGKQPNFPMVLANGSGLTRQKAEVIPLVRPQSPAFGAALEDRLAGSVLS